MTRQEIGIQRALVAGIVFSLVIGGGTALWTVWYAQSNTEDVKNQAKELVKNIATACGSPEQNPELHLDGRFSEASIFEYTYQHQTYSAKLDDWALRQTITGGIIVRAGDQSFFCPAPRTQSTPLAAEQ